jgi:6-phosphogluconolactonase
MTSDSTKLHISDTAIGTAIDVASWLAQLLHESTGKFSIALAGGGTPKLLYGLLARDYLNSFPWERIHWYFGDERFVPRDHPDSNFRMVREQLFDPAPIPPNNIHRFDTGAADERQCAADYHSLLEREGEPALPLFDVVLLGLGEDGHTASLFPGTPALDEIDTLAVATPLGARPEPRVSLTFKAIQSSKNVAFLVCGASKQKIVADVLSGKPYPATRVMSRGTVHWFLDTAAAELYARENNLN